jgi:molybdate transport system substrate-binding protein
LEHIERNTAMRQPSLSDRFRCLAAALAAALCALAPTAYAGEVKVAVAANFTAAAKEIGALFKQRTGHRAVLSFGSTGQLYTQIKHGAPFEVFLAADRLRPQKAVDEGLGVPGTLFTYATGRIVLYSRDPGRVRGAVTLSQARFSKIAVANPVTAPYGAAAVETMTALGVHDALAAKFVRGTNIAQTYQFVATGNAELGFVALSQIAGHRGGSRWIVPDRLYTAIAQGGVLLKSGAKSAVARRFVAFVRGKEARAVKLKYGYGAGE